MGSNLAWILDVCPPFFCVVLRRSAEFYHLSEYGLIKLLQYRKPRLGQVFNASKKNLVKKRPLLQFHVRNEVAEKINFFLTP
jgi:hypothetical protein